MQSVLARRIKDLGFHLILSDGSQSPFCQPLADTLLHIDTFDAAAHLREAEKLRARLDIKAVVTTAADCHQTVARLAQALGLPHLDPAICDICRDKTKTRELLTKAGLRQPQAYGVSSYEEALDVCAKFSTAIAMKATDSSGSRGFSKLEKGERPTRESFENALGHGTTGKVILETYLVPHPQEISEASVETLWVNGKMYWINWVDRIFPRDLQFFPMVQMVTPPAGIEIGHINPALHEFDTKKIVESEIHRAGLALGMDRQKGAHILKADIYFSDKGPVILEMTPRTSGGWDSSGSSIARGADLPGGILHIALGGEITLESWMKYFQFNDNERKVLVMAQIPENPKDCTGRQFTLVSGYGSIESLFEPALKKIERGDYIVPVL